MLKLAIATLLFSTSLGANAVDCSKKADEIAVQLDSVYSLAEGPFQGDFDEPQYIVNEKGSSKNILRYEATFDHMNEDNEGWITKYEIKLNKQWCSLISFHYLGTLSE